jgi:cellulose synthase/poly-beta-1,6-N-acetylglucosamine synthase-like glycosyltransferase
LLLAVIFWASLFLIAYAYVLYPAILFLSYSSVQVYRDWRFLLSRCSRRAHSPCIDRLPAVALIVPAYNESTRLREKIKNIEELDYPAEKLEVVIVSDGSTDGTNDILESAEDRRVHKILLPVRQGKANALNEAVRHSHNGLLIFSDASTLFMPDAVVKLVRHFSDARVGAACGSLQFRGSEESQQTEGVYWKYESMLRLMESRLGATLTASGAIYALRRDCYPNLPTDTLIEDFVIPMNARRLGYRVVYDPEAVATEFAAPTVAGEFTRRARLAAGSFRALGQLLRTRQPFLTLWAFLSHKFLRWIIPFLLVAALLANALLILEPLYRFLFVLQFLFYSWALAGFLVRQRPGRVPFGRLAYFVTAMNLAYLVGFFRCVFGRAPATWQRVE